MPDQPLISTPSYLRERAREIHMMTLSMNTDMARKKDRGRIAPNAPQLEAWRAWRDGFAKWYGDTDGSTWMWGATGELLDQFAAQLQAWRNWYAVAFGEQVSMVARPTNPDEPRAGIPGWLLAAGGLGLGYLFAKMMSR